MQYLFCKFLYFLLFRGGLHIYGVDIERKNNFEFENYEAKFEDDYKLLYKINEKIMPEKYKKLIKSKE